jgi:hypothetical protein
MSKELVQSFTDKFGGIFYARDVQPFFDEIKTLNASDQKLVLLALSRHLEESFMLELPSRTEMFIMRTILNTKGLMDAIMILEGDPEDEDNFSNLQVMSHTILRINKMLGADAPAFIKQFVPLHRSIDENDYKKSLPHLHAFLNITKKVHKEQRKQRIIGRRQPRP